MKEEPKRYAFPIRTVFYFREKVVRINRAFWANNAVPNAIKHMQINQYDATHCEVFDMESGVLHAVIKYNIGAKKIEILFKREVKEGM